jgi:hypothetical protein
MNNFVEEADIDTIMTAKERARLIGAGVRNYGLIDKWFDVVRDNPAFVPQFLSPEELWDDMHAFEEARQLVWVLEKFLQLANDVMMIRGNKCFQNALSIYGNLKELSKRGVPGAKPLYEALLKFFRKRRKPGDGEDEPTMEQMEKDFHSLLHGRADGKIEIINHRPKTSAGKRVFVDEVNRGRGAVKETVEVED